MRILHILDHSLPLQSGYAFRSQNILQAQRKRGWQPVALTSPKHEESRKGFCNRAENISGVRYYRTGAISNNSLPFNKEIRLMMALSRRIQEIIELKKPNILHAHSPILNAIPALWVGWKRGIPVVYEIRAFWEDAAVDHGTYSEDSWKYKLVRLIETWICRKADHVGVLCCGLKEDLIKRGISPEKITVVYNGIEVEDFNTCEPDAEYLKAWDLNGKKVIGFIGSFYRYEGLDLLINAFSQLSTTMPDAMLLLVGGGEMEQELKEQIQRSNLTEKAIMTGPIPHDRIAGVYALIDVLVYPRYSMRLTELVTPLKPLEAMAMGRALVASDVGGHRELIRHDETGILFEAGNVDALVEALERLLKDKSRRKKVEKQGYSWVRQVQTWDQTTSVYEEMYGKVVNKSK
jgi:PEP-CTERM/exosortase A-associated glycosyltransferase